MCDWTKEMRENSGCVPKQSTVVLRVLVTDDPATNIEDNAVLHQKHQQPAVDSTPAFQSIAEDVDNHS